MKKIVSAILATFLLSLFSITAFAADTKVPSNVENVKGTALDKSAKITWDKATDDVGVTGYKVYYDIKPVTEKGQTYKNNVDAKNVQEYVVPGLENGTKYYFTIIAYDAAGNESAKWSKVAIVTPEGGVAGGEKDDSTDKDAPQVADAEALNSEEVKVVFSEEVVLPEEDAEDAFDVEDQDKFETLLVTGAKMDEEDDENKTVILTTSNQKENTEYKLTVGIDIKDKADNPIVSGTSDTAIFNGSGKEKPDEDTTGPSVVKVETVNNTQIIVNFDESIVLGIDPSVNFEITVDGDVTKKINVLGVKLGTNTASVENASAILTTSPQEKVKYIVKAVKVKDAVGNDVNSAKNSAIFEGIAAPPTEGKGEEGGTGSDLIPPKDVADFLADKIVKAKKYIVKLSWKIPAENKDTKEQLIYKSTDKGANYGKEATLGADKTEYEVKDLEAGEYWFKLTQKDNAGNESKGVVTKIILSKTGPGVVGLVIFSLLAGRIVTRKKK